MLVLPSLIPRAPHDTSKDKIARHLIEASPASPPSQMTQSTSTHRRSPSSPHACKSRAPRPGLHRRGTSGANLSISKLGTGHSRGVSRSRSRDLNASELDMAATFLNFWYVIELLILHLAEPAGTSCPCMPVTVIARAAVAVEISGLNKCANLSIAPCARDRSLFQTVLFSTAAKGEFAHSLRTRTPTHGHSSCRRKDSCKPLSASLSSMSSMSSMSTMTSTTPPTSPPLSPRTIVPPMTPTRAPSNPSPSIRTSPNTHDARSNLDPTEWQPVILSNKRTNSCTSLATSDAWNYLSQFHGGTEPLLRRPGSIHRSTASLPALVGGVGTVTNSDHAVPSLTHTPSMASSVSSTASEYLCSIYESSSQRPLPPRHNPYFAASAVTKGVELVVPHIVSTSADVVIEDSDSGSIFPASSAVWDDTPCDKSATEPINMTRLGVRDVRGGSD